MCAIAAASGSPGAAAKPVQALWLLQPTRTSPVATLSPRERPCGTSNHCENSSGYSQATLTAPEAPPPIVTSPVTMGTVTHPVPTPSTVTTPVNPLASGTLTTGNFFIPFSFSFIFSASSSARIWPLCPVPSAALGACQGSCPTTPWQPRPLSQHSQASFPKPSWNPEQAHPRAPSLGQTELCHLPKIS